MPLTAGVVFGCAALAVAVVVGWVLLRSAARQVKEDGQAVSHVRDRMAALKDFSGTLQQAENGRAGFLNTGDQSFLEAYREATHDLPGQLQSVASLAQGDLSQAANLVDLKRQTDSALLWMEQAIDVRSSRRTGRRRRPLSKTARSAQSAK